jgi:nitrogenase molybdenum-iron protein alpha chain
MDVDLSLAEVEVRENRLKSILSYEGTAIDLAERSKTCSLKQVDRVYSQCSNCSQGCAENITFLIKDAAVVVHSPIGCCSSSSQYNVQGEVVSRSRGLPPQKVKVICSNITESDTVYGGIEKLRFAVRTAKERFAPAAIFVHSSCAAGIIGDDIETAAAELQEELGIPIVPIFCEGFKSKIWSTGFDAGYHGILRKIVKPAKEKQKDLINVFNFQGSDTFSPMLGKLGLRVNYLVAMTSIEQLEKISEAAATAHICETLATYVARVLEKNFGVPEIKAPPPFGIKWTDMWIREVAKVTGKEDIMEAVIESEHERIRPGIEEIKAKLKGKKIYIFAGDAFAHSLANVVQDLGLELVGITTLHHDQITDAGDNARDSLSNLIAAHGDIKNFTICNKQPYQGYKLLEKTKPDVMIIRHGTLTVLGAKAGIPAVLEGDANASAGYDGIVQLGNRIYSALKTKKVLDNIKAHAELPYSAWWLEQSNPFYFEGRHLNGCHNH